MLGTLEPRLIPHTRLKLSIDGMNPDRTVVLRTDEDRDVLSLRRRNLPRSHREGDPTDDSFVGTGHVRRLLGNEIPQPIHDDLAVHPRPWLNDVAVVAVNHVDGRRCSKALR